MATDFHLLDVMGVICEWLCIKLQIFFLFFYCGEVSEFTVWPWKMLKAPRTEKSLASVWDRHVKCYRLVYLLALDHLFTKKMYQNLFI